MPMQAETCDRQQRAINQLISDVERMATAFNSEQLVRSTAQVRRGVQVGARSRGEGQGPCKCLWRGGGLVKGGLLQAGFFCRRGSC